MDEPTAVADIYNRTVKEKRRGTIEIKRQQESPLDKIVRLADESKRKANYLEKQHRGETPEEKKQRLAVRSLNRPSRRAETQSPEKVELDYIIRREGREESGTVKRTYLEVICAYVYILN